MKRVLLFLFLIASVLQGFSQLNGNGYYRVQSYYNKRYVSLVDNRGKIDVSTTSADMAALRTVLGFERVVSDPSTIIYIKKMNSGYDLQAQGTGSYAIITYEVLISPTGDGTYWAYASKGGMSKYLADQNVSWMWSDDDLRRIYGEMTSIGKPSATSVEADWNILPVAASGDNYFGITPSVSAGNAYYHSFYASFPFTFSSTGMTAYYVSLVDAAKSAVVVKEVSGGVPASTPVIVKCSSDQPANNKLNIGAATTGSASGNLLKGVYFCNDVESAAHRNVVNYDSETMRVLGTATDGSLAFVKSSTLQYIPANTAYITVEAGAPDVLKVYTQAEYDALPSAMRGDLSGDGKVSGLDLVYMGNMIIGTREKTAEADLNGDGKVSGLDYVILVNIILNQQ